MTSSAVPARAAQATPSPAPRASSSRIATLRWAAGELQGLLTGVVVASVGLFLLQASHTLTGGLAGVALMISYALPGVPFGAVACVVSAPFLVLAFRRKGVGFGLRTTAALLAVSGLAALHPLLAGPVRLNAVWAALTGNLLLGIGMLIMFRHRASLGGINTVALLLEERLGWKAGYVQGAFDLVVVTVSLAVAGPVQVAVSLVGVVVLNLVLALNHRPSRAPSAGPEAAGRSTAQ